MARSNQGARAESCCLQVRAAGRTKACGTFVRGPVSNLWCGKYIDAARVCGRL